MKKAAIICRRYVPGTAWTNRMLCYAKGLLACNYMVEIIFVISDKERSTYSLPISNIVVHNLWENDSWIASRIRPLSFFINRNRLKKNINDADVCLMFDAGGLFVNRLKGVFPGLRIFVEITEHPEIWSYPKLLKKWFICKQIQMIKDADQVLVITNSLRKYLVGIGIPENRVKVVNIFVDSERFKGLPKNNTNNVIAYCGTLGYQKDGIDVLLKAFSIFIKKHPDYKLVLYGKGENENTIHSLSIIADELGISKKVFFMGYTSYEVLPQKLMNAKMLVLSRPKNKQNDNGFPTKLGEYLVTANPVVVTSVGEIPLFIKDGVTGFLAEPGDAQSFAQKMLYVAENYEDACEVGERGKHLALNEFSYNKQVARIFKYH